MVNSLLKVFHNLSTAKSAVDPSSVLKSLSDVVIKSGNTNFEIFSQHDAPEVLVHLLSECSVASPCISGLFESEISILSYCESCDTSSIEIETVIRVPVSRSISESIEKSLQKVHSDRFCFSCEKETVFSEVKNSPLVVIY